MTRTLSAIEAVRSPVEGDAAPASVESRETEILKRVTQLRSMLIDLMIAQGDQRDRYEGRQTVYSYTWPAEATGYEWRVRAAQKNQRGDDEQNADWSMPFTIDYRAIDAPSRLSVSRMTLDTTAMRVHPSHHQTHPFGGELETVEAVTAPLDWPHSQLKTFANLVAIKRSAASVGEDSQSYVDRLRRGYEYTSRRAPEATLAKLRLMAGAAGEEFPAVLNLEETYVDQDEGKKYGETYVAVNLGQDAAGRSYRAFYNDTRRADASARLPDVVEIRDEYGGQLYRIDADGWMTTWASSQDPSHEEQILRHRLADLDARLTDAMVSELQRPSGRAPFNARVALLVYLTAKDKDVVELGASMPHGVFRVGEDEVRATVRQTDASYMMTMTVVSPDGEQPHTRRVVVPRDLREPIIDVGGKEGRVDIEELVEGVIDRVANPPSHQEQTVPSLHTGDVALGTLNDLLATNIASRFHREPDFDPTISRMRSDVFSDSNGNRYRVVQFGRIAEDGHIAMHHTFVAVGERTYRLTQDGFRLQAPRRRLPLASYFDRRRADEAFGGFLEALHSTGRL